MKKYLFGFFAIALAIAFSAFTTVKENNNWVFFQVSEGFYSLNPGSATDCGSSSSNPCTITYSEDPLVTTFAIESRPEGGTDSQATKIYDAQ